MSEPEQEVRNYWWKDYNEDTFKIGKQCDACGEKLIPEYVWHEFFTMNYTCTDCAYPIAEKEIAIVMKKFPELPNNKETHQTIYFTVLDACWEGCDAEQIEEVVFEYVDELTCPNE